jgi:hypothetical protein
MLRSRKPEKLPDVLHWVESWYIGRQVGDDAHVSLRIPVVNTARLSREVSGLTNNAKRYRADLQV